MRNADVLLRASRWPEALRSMAGSPICAREQMGAERAPLSDVEDGWRQAEVMERAAGPCLLQQHGLRLAQEDPPHAREGPHALLRGDRRGSNKKKHVHVPPEGDSWTAEIVRRAH